MGLSEEDIDERVHYAAHFTGISRDLFDKSPFELSGGQKRRVAIAGVLATEPEVLILDEPAAGLDPSGRERLWGELHKIRKEQNTTIILISHSMEDLAQNAERIIVLNSGEKYRDDTVSNIFSDADLLRSCSLELPEITKVIKLLNDGGMNIPENIFDITELARVICKGLGAIE